MEADKDLKDLSPEQRAEILAADRQILDDAPEVDPADDEPTVSMPAPDEGPDAGARRLAALPEAEYERCRKEKAKELGVRVTFLDRLVEAFRHEDDPEPESLVAAPEPWPDPVDGAALLTELAATVRRFIVLSEHKARALALWSVHTHAIEAAAVTPILALVSPQKRCGKTTALSLAIRLSARPLVASNISPAAVFRIIEEWRPTLLIDEADTFIKDNEELRGVLNSGHTRDTAYVLRMEKVGEGFEPRRFTTWAAKAIAMIGRLPDTLADRSIEIALERKLPSERVEKLRHAGPELFIRLAAQAARWALDNCDRLRSARPALPDRLHDRAADNWEPLLAIADLAGEAWPRLARDAALALSGEEAAVEADSLATRLLRDMRPIVEDYQGDGIPTAVLLDKLNAIEEAPWSEITRANP
ncbi:MAG: DUF3631 domain-containing protein [Cyanobacteria bacterium REEB65]|nr:DUF3631 domain-containing protein [Cyanobacteria bacterium REEB65]